MNPGRILAGCALAALCLLSTGAHPQSGPVPPTISKAFGLPSIDLGVTTTLTFSLNNPNFGLNLTGVGFSDNLPSGLQIATPNGLSGNCGGGTIVAPAGSTVITLSGATLTKASSCTFSVDVKGVQVGVQNNFTSKVSSVEAGSGPGASASITVNTPGPPQVSATKSFSPATIDSGGTSVLTVFLANNDVNNDANNLAFTDTFPAGMTSAPGATFDNCSDGGLTVTASGFSIAGGFISSDGGTCSVSVPMTATASVTTTLTNVTSTFTCTNRQGFLCTGKAASGDLVVIGTGSPPVISSGPPPPGTVGVPYTFTLKTIGSPTPTLSASGLPPGLTLSGNKLSGTPTKSGVYPSKFIASNGVTPDDSKTYDIVILDPLAITIPGCSSTLPGGSTGLPYGPVTFTGSGGVPPYTFSACKQPVPPGLTLSAGGVLAGTPTQAGTFTFDLCLTDSRGVVTTQSVTVALVTINSTMTLTVTPDPAAASYPVVVAAKVTGASVAPTGFVQFWVAGTGTKCPKQFAAGKPTDPDAPVRTAALDTNGRAQLSYANLRIDDYLVCAQYAGDSVYPQTSAGPVDLAVIKGLVLPPPGVTLSVPSKVAASARVEANVVVTGTDGMRVPQGSVSIRIGEREIATAQLLGGSAVIAINMPSSGLFALTADYAGDGLYPPASSDTATVQVGELLAAPAVPGGVDIPTLSEWMLALLALTLVALGVRRLRRR
jgi:Bacterial Ig-like domain (group 3)/IPTL-CTERM motif